MASMGAKDLSKALMNSDDSLETLNLELNRVNEWGAGWFAMVIRNNNVLKCLNLNGNPIGQDGLDELASACETMESSLVILPYGADSPAGMGSVAVGQRLCTVYVSAAEAPCQEANSELRRCRSAEAYRPVAVRQRAIAMKRHNATLKIDEPASVMADSAGCNDRDQCQSSERPRSRPLSASTYPIDHVSASNDVMLEVASEQRPSPIGASCRHGLAPRTHTEREFAKEEKETATALVQSRWRWKPRTASLSGGAERCSRPGRPSRRLRRAESAPRRCQREMGMLMGPRAASAAAGG